MYVYHCRECDRITTHATEDERDDDRDRHRRKRHDDGASGASPVDGFGVLARWLFTTWPGRAVGVGLVLCALFGPSR